MKGFYKKPIFTMITAVTVSLFFCGCQPQESSTLLERSETAVDLGTTIGSLAEVFAPDTIIVEGFGLVGGLKGTGSAECPPALRAYLVKYIKKQLPEEKMNINKFIDSHNTAVVNIQGKMPTAFKNQYFDVTVTAIAGSQTTSLENGWLYEVELKAGGRFSLGAKVLATVEGPVYIDKIESSPLLNHKTGFILAGGNVRDEYKISLVLHKPDYKISSFIRNRLLERFGDNTAKAISDEQIVLTVPPKYKYQKKRFIEIVKATYLVQDKEITEKRIDNFIRKLAILKDVAQSEIALETLGKASLGKLAALLNSSREPLRLSAARCMLNIGSDKGLDTLRQIAIDKNSKRRIEALKAITLSANRNDAASISRILLRDDEFEVKLAAYEQLRRLNDISISQKLVGRNFYLEQIAGLGKKAIFASRSGLPRIVLFGAPIYCRENVFIRSEDGNVTINAPAGQKDVSIIRKFPGRPGAPVQLKSSFELGDIIRTLCEEPTNKTHPGLGVSYGDCIAILKQMSDKGTVQAAFRAGPLPKFN